MRKIPCETCATRDYCLVSNFPEEAFEHLRALATNTIYKARQVVFSEGSTSLGLYLLCQGAVKLYHSDRFGHDHILEIAGPGSVLGEISVDSDHRLSVSAETLRESQIYFLPHSRLEQIIERSPMMGMRLLAALSSELALARRKVRDLALKGAESRLAALLVQLARASGDVPAGKLLQLRYSRRELAEMIGVSTETAIRLLGKLKQKRAITIDRRDVVISDLDKLNKLANYYDMEG